MNRSPISTLNAGHIMAAVHALRQVKALRPGASASEINDLWMLAHKAELDLFIHSGIGSVHIPVRAEEQAA